MSIGSNTGIQIGGAADPVILPPPVVRLPTGTNKGAGIIAETIIPKAPIFGLQYGQVGYVDPVTGVVTGGTEVVGKISPYTGQVVYGGAPIIAPGPPVPHNPLDVPIIPPGDNAGNVGLNGGTTLGSSTTFFDWQKLLDLIGFSKATNIVPGSTSGSSAPIILGGTPEPAVQQAGFNFGSISPIMYFVGIIIVLVLVFKKQ